MLNRISIGVALLSVTALGATWSEATGKLVPGGRVEVQHKGKIERGIYALSNANEIVITTVKNYSISIPQGEVDRVTKLGVEAPNLGYFANMHDQLFPKPEVVYERPGAPRSPAVGEKKRHWWSKR